MKLSAAGLALVKRSEGFRSRIYFDAAGFPTIGYGHRLEPAEHYPNGITEPQAEVILLWDVREAEMAVERLVRAPLTQGQFDALVDFTFNMGSARLASSTLLKELNSGNSDLAADELLRWDHSGAEELESLKARRQAEYALWHAAQPAQAAA